MHVRTLKSQVPIETLRAHRFAHSQVLLHPGAFNGSAQRLRCGRTKTRAQRHVLCTAEGRSDRSDGSDKTWEELLSSAAGLTRDIGAKLGESAKGAASSVFSDDSQRQRRQRQSAADGSGSRQQAESDLSRDLTRALKSGLGFASSVAEGVSGVAGAAVGSAVQAMQDTSKFLWAARVSAATLEALRNEPQALEAFGAPIEAGVPSDIEMFEAVDGNGRTIEGIRLNLPIKGSRREEEVQVLYADGEVSVVYDSDDGKTLESGGLGDLDLGKDGRVIDVDWTEVK